MLDKNNFVKVDYHCLTSGGYQVQIYVHIFFCFMVIRPWLNLPTGAHGHMICIGNLVGVFSCENTAEGHRETHKS